MQKFRSLLLSILVLGLLSACAEELIYKNPNLLVNWYIDDYVALNDRQQEMLSEQVTAFQIWHQNQELPLYIQHLGELEQWSLESSPKNLQEHSTRFSEHWDRFLARLSPKLYVLGLGLSAEQRTELFDNIKQQYAQNSEKDSQLSPNEAISQRIDNISEQAEDWLGELSPDQALEIEILVKQLRPTREAWMAYRVKRTLTIEQLLSLPYSSENQQLFYQTMTVDESKLSLGLQQDLAYNRKLWQQSLTNVLQMAKPKQRQHLEQQFAQWRERFEDWTS